MGKRIVSLFLALLMLMSAFSLSAFALDTFTDGDYSYTVSNSGAKITDCASTASVLDVPEKLGDFKVVGIGAFAFQNSSAGVVNLPESVKSIDENAFASSALTDVYIPAGCTDIHASASDKALRVYSFGESAAKACAEASGSSYQMLSAKQKYNSYVGKTLTLSDVPAEATLVSTSQINTVSGKKVNATAVGDDSVFVQLTNGIRGVISIHVNPAPVSISGLPKNVNLYVGNVYSKVKPTIAGGEYEDEFTYSVKDPTIASVDKNCVITALKPGKTTLTVKYSNGISGSFNLNVGNVAEDFCLDQEDLLLGVGEPAALTFTLQNNQVVKKVTYVSSNPKVADADAKGNIKAKAVGTATITATTDAGKSDSCIISVAKAPTTVKLAKSEITMGIGEKTKIKASVNSGAVCSTYLWRSRNKNVFTVDDNGNITARGVGTAKLYVYTYNYLSKDPMIKAYCTIHVKKAPKSVTFNKTNLVLGVGERFDLNCVLPSGTASYKKTVEMEDTSIAQNGEKMIITALALGKTTFKLTTFNGKTATCNITVKPAPERVACKPTKVKLALKQSYQLSPYVNKGTVCSSYKYKSSNKKVCTVSASGKVKVKDYGSCYIYIYTYNHTAENPIYCKVKFNVGYITNKVSSYTTYFDRYYYGKSVNLKMACKYINGKTDGYILQPGQVFSFNRAVGARTSARGFVDAKVIVGGTYVDGIGGGICQAATTIFNTTLLGNFSVVERHYHDLKSSYCPVGRDATVSWGSQDYKFKNNYNTPIRIKMNYNSGGSINCTIYSLKKVKVPKIALPVSRAGRGYKLVRKANGKANYTTYSYYSN